MQQIEKTNDKNENERNKRQRVEEEYLQLFISKNIPLLVVFLCVGALNANRRRLQLWQQNKNMVGLA